MPKFDCPIYNDKIGWIGNSSAVGCSTGSTIGMFMFLSFGVFGLVITGIGSLCFCRLEYLA
jgi:hypothetical protein